MEKRLRCKDCKFRWYHLKSMRCYSLSSGKDRVNPGQFACKKFVFKDIGAHLAYLADEEPSFIAEIH